MLRGGPGARRRHPGCGARGNAAGSMPRGITRSLLGIGARVMPQHVVAHRLATRRSRARRGSSPRCSATGELRPCTVVTKRGRRAAACRAAPRTPSHAGRRERACTMSTRSRANSARSARHVAQGQQRLAADVERDVFGAERQQRAAPGGRRRTRPSRDGRRATSASAISRVERSTPPDSSAGSSWTTVSRRIGCVHAACARGATRGQSSRTKCAPQYGHWHSPLGFDRQVHARMRVPQRHRRQRAAQRQVGAVHVVALSRRWPGWDGSGLRSWRRTGWRRGTRAVYAAERASLGGRGPCTNAGSWRAAYGAAGRTAGRRRGRRRRRPAAAWPASSQAQRIAGRQRAAVDARRCHARPATSSGARVERDARRVSPRPGARRAADAVLADRQAAVARRRARPAAPSAARVGGDRRALRVGRLRVEPVGLDPDLQEMHRLGRRRVVLAVLDAVAGAHPLQFAGAGSRRRRRCCPCAPARLRARS